MLIYLFCKKKFTLDDRRGLWIKTKFFQELFIPSLRASGFHSFGWVFKGEQPGGASLGPHHEQGAFVYGHNDGGFYYYQLYLPEQAKLLSALAALTGPMLQLNNAMVASVTTAKVRLHHLKEGVERLRAEDQRLMRDAQALSMAEIGATGVWARTHELRLRLLSLASMALGLLVAAALLWLAPLSSAEEHLLGMSAFRMLSSLIWFGLLTLFVWRILADCSAEGLSRQQRLLAGRLLVFVPLLSTLSECITLGREGGTTGVRPVVEGAVGIGTNDLHTVGGITTDGVRGP